MEMLEKGLQVVATHGTALAVGFTAGVILGGKVRDYIAKGLTKVAGLFNKAADKVDDE